jgi:hypothetical protein
MKKRAIILLLFLTLVITACISDESCKFNSECGARCVDNAVVARGCAKGTCEATTITPCESAKCVQVSKSQAQCVGGDSEANDANANAIEDTFEATLSEDEKVKLQQSTAAVASKLSASASQASVFEKPDTSTPGATSEGDTLGTVSGTTPPGTTPPGTSSEGGVGGTGSTSTGSTSTGSTSTPDMIVQAVVAVVKKSTPILQQIDMAFQLTNCIDAQVGFTPTIPLKDAIALIQVKLLAPSEFEGGKPVAYIYPNVVFPGDKILEGIFGPITMTSPGYVAYIDPESEAQSNHEGLLVMVFEDGMRVVGVSGEPIVGGDFISRSGQQFFNGDKGGFPTNLDGCVIPIVPEVVPLSKVDSTALSPVILPPTKSSIPDAGPNGECPPGFIPGETQAVRDSDFGVGIAVLGPTDSKLDQEWTNYRAESERWKQGLLIPDPQTGGIWGLQPDVRNADSLHNMLNQLSDTLPAQSRLAMFISAPSQRVYKVTLEHVVTKEQKVISNFPGVPWSNAVEGTDYSSCFPFLPDTTFVDERSPLCQDLLIRHRRVPAGYAVLNKERLGWCFELNDACVVFDSNAQLGPIQSCEKTLVSNGPYSQKLTEHSVKALGVYVGSQSNHVAYNQPAPEGIRVKMESVFGNKYTTYLLEVPAHDPTNPVNPSRPEFDGAYGIAASEVSEQSAPRSYEPKFRKLSYKGKEPTAVKFPIELQQQAVSNVILPDVCKVTTLCIPVDQIIPTPQDDCPTPPTPFDTPSKAPDDTSVTHCDTLKEYIAEFPGILEEMATAGADYKHDRSAVISDMLERLEQFKDCFKCQPTEFTRTKNCDPWSGPEEANAKMQDLLRNFKNNGFAMGEFSTEVVEGVSLTLRECRVRCLQTEGGEPVETPTGPPTPPKPCEEK